MSIRSLFTVFALFATLTISACQTTGSSSSGVTYNPITTATAFEGAVVGKKLVSAKGNGSFVIIAADKSWSGEWGGAAHNGMWKFEDGMYCRTDTAGSDDCQIFALSSMFDSVTVKSKNSGKTSTFKFAM